MRASARKPKKHGLISNGVWPCCVLRNALWYRCDPIVPAQRAEKVLWVGNRGRYSTRPREAIADAFGRPWYSPVDRGYERSRVSSSPPQGRRTRSLVSLGKWELTLNVWIRRRTSLRLGLWGLPL